MKIMICGHGRHGKDTVAHVLARELELNFCSTSWIILERVIWPNLGHLYGQFTIVNRYNQIYEKDHPCDDCIQFLKESVFLERHRYRQIWADAVNEFNSMDSARLCKKVLQASDIYVGCRSRTEFLASKRLFDFSIWVEASNRVNKKSEDFDKTCAVTSDDCDIVLANEDCLETLHDNVALLAHEIRQGILSEITEGNHDDKKATRWEP